MRELKYISPSGYMMYKRSPDKFFRVYLADDRMPLAPATDAMGVGSCFDVIVKNSLLFDLGIKDQPEQTYPNDTTQEAIEAGHHVFSVYQESGAYDALLRDIRECYIDPRMEDKIVGEIEVDGVKIPLGGLPDLYYYTKSGRLVVLDWKVNGYYSRSTRSPNKGWVRLYARKKEKWEVTEGHKTSEYLLTEAGLVNAVYNLEDVYRDWAVQLSIYGWCLGSPDYVTRIEQIVAKPGEDKPELRIASHCNFVGLDFREELRQGLKELWLRAKGPWFEEDGERKERLLNKMNLMAANDKKVAVISFEDLHAQTSPTVSQ